MVQLLKYAAYTILQIFLGGWDLLLKNVTLGIPCSYFRPWGKICLKIIDYQFSLPSSNLHH